MFTSLHRIPGQRGVASLAVAMVLLFGMTLIAFFASRSMVFEQRTSANQYRATKAFEAAEAGIEWALAQINEQDCISETLGAGVCDATGGVVSYRTRYINPVAGGFTPLTGRRSGCSLSTNAATRAVTLNCHAPASSTLALGGAATDPRFAIEWNAGPDPRTVELISTGCVGQGPPCDGSGSPEATAVVRVLLRVSPDLPSAPGAGLTSGGVAITAGSIKVVNTDRASNGITINSGSTVGFSSSMDLETIEGSSLRASVLDNDTALAALATNPDAFFKQYFGKTPSEWRVDGQTIVLTNAGNSGPAFSAASPGFTCNNANNCGEAVSYYMDRGNNKFWVQGNVDFGNCNTCLPTTFDGNLGSRDFPVLLASSGDIGFSANIKAFGLFYASTLTVANGVDPSGQGTATVFGALVTNGNFCRVGQGGTCSNAGNGTLAGNLTVVYDPVGLTDGPPKGLLVRVPGSWRDSRTDL